MIKIQEYNNNLIENQVSINIIDYVKEVQIIENILIFSIICTKLKNILIFLSFATN